MQSNDKLSGHFSGPGGITQVLGIAFPMIVSQGAETMMMFVDRLFLARLSPAHLAASLSGGLTVFMMMTFFFGVIGYVNALVAQFLGAERPKQCGVASAQGLILSLACFPLICASIPLGILFMKSMGHSPEQFALESVYFKILSFGSVIALLRVGFGSFFSGIGRTRIVMGANVAAMVVNIGANYVLIFGKFGVPAMGIEGAAYGTIIGSAVGAVVLGWFYFQHKNEQGFGTRSGLHFHAPTFRKLLKFGTPAGTEFFLNIAAFNVFIQAFHSYGEVEAAAMTITFSWDLMAFLPITGISIAVTSLVGRYMGARKPELALRSTHSALKVAWCFSLFMTCLFVFIPGVLVQWFASRDLGGEYEAVVPLATTMLRIAAAYTLFDSTNLVFSGALRGAGDTKWVLWVSVGIHWFMAAICIGLIYTRVGTPVGVWCIFALLIGVLAATFFLRFKSGHWKTISILESNS